MKTNMFTNQKFCGELTRGSLVGLSTVVRGSRTLRFAAMLLMLVTMSVGQVWGETKTIDSSTQSTSDVDFPITSTLSSYSYGTNMMQLSKGGSFSITNKNGYTVTGISIIGIAQNNDTKSSTIVVSDGEHSINTGSVVWANRNSTATVKVLDGVNTLSSAKNTVYTFTNGNTSSDYALGIKITITYTVAPSNTYYYRGTDNGWGSSVMAVSEDGFYEYFATSTNDHQFKISTCDEAVGTWNCGTVYNHTYKSAGFNGTDINKLYDYGGDNCYCTYNNGAYFILVYYPNTAINTSNNPIICASTTLPNDAPEVFEPTAWSIIGDLVGGNDNANDVFFDASGDAIVSNVASGTKKFKLRKDQAWTETKGWSELNGKITATGCSVADASDYNNINLTVSATKDLAFHFDGTNLSITATDPAPSTHTITFDKDGKGTTATQTGVPDNTPTALKTISEIGWTMTGNTFAGWAETAGGDVVYTDGASITITADKTLYAKWTKNNYTVTLNNQDATTAGAASVTVTYGSKTNIATGSEPPTPTAISLPAKIGYTFGGYYTATDGGGTQVIGADGKFIAGTSYVSDGYNWSYADNITLYAKWTEDAPSGECQNITFGTSSKTIGADKTTTIDGITIITALDGDGWQEGYGEINNNDDYITFTSTSGLIAGIVNMRSNSDAHKLVVTYASNIEGTANTSSEQITTNTTFTDYTLTIPAGTKYIKFMRNGTVRIASVCLEQGDTPAPADAWSMWRNGTKVDDFTKNSAISFTLSGYELRNDNREQNIVFKNNETSYSVEANYACITSKTELVQDQSFRMNCSNGTYDITITKENGTWYVQAVSAAPTYTVTVNDPKTSCDRVVNDVREGQEVVITNSCSVSGKHLTGYTSTPDVGGTFDSENKTYTFTMPASDVTLTAVWVDDVVETFTVTFDANGATSGTAPGAMAGNVMNQEIVLPENTGSLAKTGYTFSGWNTRADGTGTNYDAGAAYTVTGDVTLYAKWVVPAPVGCTNYFIHWNGESSAANLHCVNLTTGDAIAECSSLFTFSSSTDVRNGSVTYDEQTYNPGVKINSSGNIHFTPKYDGVVTLYFSSNNSFKLDGVVANIESGNKYHFEATADHEYIITRNSSETGVNIIEFVCSGPKYYIKHPWNAGDWSWKQLADNGDGTYSIEDYYGGSGCNWNLKGDDTDATWVEHPTLIDGPASGDLCIFTLNPATGTITITKIISTYYIYLGQTLTLPEGVVATYDASDVVNNVPAYYYDNLSETTVQYNRAGALTIDGRSVTGKTLGKFQISQTGSRTGDVTVYVYRYYAKYPWGACNLEPAEDYNKAWKWQAMANPAGDNLRVVGLYSHAVDHHANVAWDYAYDWDGLYKYDGSGTPNLHPGLDEHSNQGKWIDGTDVTSGGSVYKEIPHPSPDLNCAGGDYIELDYAPGTLTGPDEPSLSTNFTTQNGGSVAAEFKTLTYVAVPEGGGVITHNASADKVAQGTKVTFHAEANSGYVFLGWYSDEECTSEITGASVNAVKQSHLAIVNANYTVYAKFEPTTYTYKVYGNFEGDWTDYDLTDGAAIIRLNENSQYDFKIKKIGNDGTEAIFGASANDNKYTVTCAGVPWTLNTNNYNVHLYGAYTGNYTFRVDGSGTYPIVRVDYPSNNQAADKVLYFDNSQKWSAIYYRIGRATHNTCLSSVGGSPAITPVPGTARLYQMNTIVYDNFLAYHFANNAGYTNDNSVYLTNTNDSYAIDESSEFEHSAVLTDAATITMTTPGNMGEDPVNENCRFYPTTVHAGLLTHTLTIGSHANGTIKLAWTDITGTNHENVAETTAGLAHTCLITITPEANTGYTLTALKVDGATVPLTDGAYVLTLEKDVEVALVCTANQYAINYMDQGDAPFSGTGWESTQPTTHTYGTATALVNPTKANSLFMGWYETHDCQGAPVTSLGATAVTANKTLYAKWAEYCFAMVVNVPTTKDADVDLTEEKSLSSLTGGTVEQSGLDGNTKNKGLKFGNNSDYIKVDLTDPMQLGKNTRIIVSFYADKNDNQGITFGTTANRPTVSDANSILVDVAGDYDYEEFVVTAESPLFEQNSFYIYRAGGSATYIQAVYVVDCSKICNDPAPKIVEVSHVGGCVPSYTVKAVDQSENNLISGTFQWYKDGVAIGGATSQSYTITEAGTYTVEYTDNCPVLSSNSFEVEHLNPTVQKLVPFQYFHADSTYAAGDVRHLFTFDAAKYQVAAIKNVDGAYTIPTGAVYRKTGTDGVDTLMLNRSLLNNLAIGDSLTITATPVDECDNVFPGSAASVKIYAIAKATKTLAFILPGANSPTKYKKFFVLDGDFLTGYNKADLFLQNDTANSKNQKAGVLCYDPDTELPLYTDLKANFLVTPVNGYAKFNIFNYEPFDILFLTDFVKSDGSSNAAAAKKHVEDLGLLVDYRPMFSTKGHMSGFNNWKEKGFTANPTVPKQSQLLMNIVCYAHPMFEGLTPDGVNVFYDANDPNETVFQMLSQGGYDAGKGIQGFEMNGANEFIKIALTHYDAHGNAVENTMTPVPETDDRTLIASCERQANINARFMILSLNADATCFLTEAGRNVIIRSMKYLLETDPMKVTDCHFEFDDANETGVWSDAANWGPRHNVLPTKNVDVRIAANCLVNNTAAIAAGVKIKDGVTLTIADNGALTIQGIAQHVSNEGVLSPTRPSDLVVNSSSTGNGAFIHGDNVGRTGATMQLYTKANIVNKGAGQDHDEVWNFQYIGIPFNDVTDASQNLRYSYIYVWTPSGWDVVHNEAPLSPFEGYCITQDEAMTYNMTGTLVSTENKSISVPSGYTVIGNSWSAPIDIKKFTAEDFSGISDHTIYMFNTGMDLEGEGSVSAGNDAPGTYVSIPIHAADYTGHNQTVIPAMQGFYVSSTTAGTLKLDYDRVVRAQATDDEQINKPLRVQAKQTAPNVLYMQVRGRRYTDNLYILEREDFSRGFDNGWDGEKWTGEDYAPMLYAISDRGQEAVDAIPAVEGTIVGFRAGEDNMYTLSFEYDETLEPLYLLDTYNNEYTRILNGNDYTFFTDDRKEHNRFLLTHSGPSGVTTGIAEVSMSDGIISNAAGEALTISIYDASGKICSLVKTRDTIIQPDLPYIQGVYMIYITGKNTNIVKKVVR